MDDNYSLDWASADILMVLWMGRPETCHKYLIQRNKEVRRFWLLMVISIANDTLVTESNGVVTDFELSCFSFFKYMWANMPLTSLIAFLSQLLHRKKLPKSNHEFEQWLVLHDKKKWLQSYKLVPSRTESLREWIVVYWVYQNDSPLNSIFFVIQPEHF